MTLIEAIRIARDEWEWLAIDKNGVICAYNDKPICGGNRIWFAGSGMYNEIGKHTGTPINWKKSLIKLTDIKC